MKHSFTFSYTACQACTQRVNCDRCEELLRKKLLAVPGISAAELQMAKKQLAVDASFDDNELCDILEEFGVFI